MNHPFRKSLSLILVVMSMGQSTAQARSAKASHTPSLEDLATVSMPKDQDVCFSPEEQCDLKLIKLIQSAQTSIDVAVYDISLDMLAHQLLTQGKKIHVRILVDKRQSKEKNSVVGLLIKAGANVRYGHQRGIMHNKFAIIDGKMMETGSYNYTNHATQANNENQIYLASPTIVKRYVDRFEKIWQEGQPASGAHSLAFGE
jgi:phosphatidylserine/phosphatidylglycerophosphate/cardiolipin synthase-like enzyme